MVAVAGSKMPFMFSISVTGAAATLRSYALTVYSDFPRHLQQIQIQMDIGATGTLYVGNSNVTSAMCGSSLVATQTVAYNTVSLGQILTDDIYLLASTGTIQVNIIATPR